MAWSGNSANESGSDGFYRGDAPVSAPGWSGAPPGEFNRPSTVPSPPPRRPRSGGGIAVILLALVFFVVAGGSLYYLSKRPQPEPETPVAQPPVSRTTASSPATPPAYQTAVVQPEEAQTSAPQSVPELVVTPMGQPGEISAAGMTLQITVTSAIWQPSAYWTMPWEPTADGFLVISMAVTAVDGGTAGNQISWSDWQYQADEGALVEESELIGGGYDPMLTTIRPATGETAAGTITFAIKSASGVLILNPSTGPAGKWAVSVQTAEVPQATFDQPATSLVGLLPFQVTVSQPVWVSGADVDGEEPPEGFWVYADYTLARIDAGPDQEYVSPDYWRFYPDQGGEYTGGYGVALDVQVDSVVVSPGGTGGGRFLISTPGVPGTLALVGEDDTAVMTWRLEGP